MTPQPATPTSPKPWDRQHGEPWPWFLRFGKFLRIGPARSIEAAWRAEYRGPAKRPNSGWYRMAREWKWTARAEAYDGAQAQPKLPDPEVFRRAILRLLEESVLALQPKVTHGPRGEPLQVDSLTVESIQTLARIYRALDLAGRKSAEGEARAG